MQSSEQARSIFELDGRWFFVPQARLGGHFRCASNGKVVDYVPPLPFDSPIRSDESLTDLGDENFVWRGYGNTHRGVIKLRVGRFLADVNLPSVDDAERLARRFADLLRTG
jgi:hypothetical protein